MSNRIKNMPEGRFDKNAKQSKILHLDDCKKYMTTVHEAYNCRKITEAQRTDFGALLGYNNTYTNLMRASDLKLRNKMGSFVIDEISNLFQIISNNSNMQAYHITFVPDDFMINERTAIAEVQKLRDKVQAAIRKYTNLNGFFIIELQPFVNYPKGDGGREYSLHVHGFCWGASDEDPADQLKRATGFKSALADRPIYVQKVTEVEGSFTRVARYMCKPPHRAKSVNFEALAEGKACLNPVTNGMKKIHHFRLFEFFSKLPIDQLFFAVRGGSQLRDTVKSKLDAWQKTRPCKHIDLSMTVSELFIDVYKTNKKLKNYSPMKVNYIRADKLRKKESKKRYI